MKLGKIKEVFQNKLIRSLIFNLVSVSLCIGTLISLTTAWYIKGGIGSSVTISTANVDSEIFMYEGIDFNHDGYLDLDSSGNDSYNSTAITESTDTTTHITAQFLEMNNIVPSKVYTWKIVATNKGDANAYLSGTISDSLVDTEGVIQYLYISLATTDSNGNITSSGTWKPISEGGTLFASDEIIYYDDYLGPTSKTFVLQIQMMVSSADYQSLQGKSFALAPVLEVVLSTESKAS